MELPEWLKENNYKAASTFAGAKHSKKRNFVAKTLAGVAAAIERTIYSDETARQNGLLQKISPIAKLVTFLAFIVLASIAQKSSTLLMVCGAVFCLAIFSKISLKDFILRVWLFAPLFSGIIALPVLLNLVTPGTPILTIIGLANPVNIFGISVESLSITFEGVMAFLFFVLRVGTIVSIVGLLTFTTLWADILKSMRTFGVPQIFALVLSLTYQYILILLRIIQDMHLVKMSRTIRKTAVNSAKKERNWVAGRIGAIFMKSKAMSEETYLAMISRGFTGETRQGDNYPFRMHDGIFVCASAVIFCCLILTM